MRKVTQEEVREWLERRRFLAEATEYNARKFKRALDRFAGDRELSLGAIEELHAHYPALVERLELLCDPWNLEVGFDKFVDDIVESEERARENERRLLNERQEPSWGRKRQLRESENIGHRIRWGRK